MSIETTASDRDLRSGRLDVLPVPNLLYRLHRRRASGTLSLQGLSQRHQVVLVDGHAASVTLGGESVEFLGRILLELGKISDAVYQKSLATLADTKRRHGEILRDMGAISDADLGQALVLQARRKLNRLFYLESGSFEFQPHAPTAREIPLMNPLPAIVNGVRTAFGDERLSRLLDPLVGLEVRLRPHFAALEPLLELTDVEKRLLPLCADFRPVSDLLSGAALPVFEARTVLATLLFTESLDARDELAAWKEAHRRPGERVTPVPPYRERTGAPEPERPRVGPGGSATPPRHPPDTPRKLRERPATPREDPAALLATKEKQIESADFFEVLGVSREDGPQQLKEAYFRLAKRFHPDRFVSAPLRAHRRRAEAVFERISEAYDTLRSPERRAEYLALLADERVRGDRRRAQMANQADGQFRRAEELLQQGDFAGAELYLRRAVELFPHDANFHAALGWATYQNEQNPRGRRFTGAIKHLLKALELSPESEGTHLSLARIYEAQGKPHEALRHFQQVLHVNPANAEAHAALERLSRGGEPG